MLKTVFVCLSVILTLISTGEKPRWQFSEKFVDGKPDKFWPEDGFRELRVTGEFNFAPYYRESGATKFVTTEDKDLAVRCILPKRDDKGEEKPFSAWRWGFKKWGGAESEAAIDIEFQVRFSENYEFAAEQVLFELFFDTAFTRHNYDGPRLVVALEGEKRVRVHAHVPQEELKTGYTVNNEKIGALPVKLERGVWHTFRFEGRLNTAPKPKDPTNVLEKEVTADGSLKLFVDGIEAKDVSSDKAILRVNNRAWTSVVWGGNVVRAGKRSVDCYANFRRFTISSP